MINVFRSYKKFTTKVIKINFLVFLLLLVTVKGFTASSVTSVSGDVEEDQTITIGGSFDSKSTAAPVLFEDFESGTNGNELSGWNVSSSHGVNPIYSNIIVKNGSLAGRGDFQGSQYNSRGSQSLGTLPEVYVSYDIYIDRTSGVLSRNLKTARVTAGTPNPQSGTPSVGHTNFDNGAIFYTFNGENLGDEDWGNTVPEGSWQRVEFYALISTIDVADGIRAFWVNNGLKHFEVNYKTYTSSAEASGYRTFVLPYYVSHGPGGQYYLYYDNVYVDSTRQRVEIKENSNCTGKSALLIPTAWSTSSITATVKDGGNFADGETGYVCVYDANGDPSNGFQVQFGTASTPSDTIPPSLISTGPPQNSSGASLSTDLTLNFTDAVGTIGNFNLTVDGNLETADVTEAGSATNKTYTLANADINVSLTNDQTITVAWSVEDTAANEGTGSYTIIFQSANPTPVSPIFSGGEMGNSTNWTEFQDSYFDTFIDTFDNTNIEYGVSESGVFDTRVGSRPGAVILWPVVQTDAFVVDGRIKMTENLANSLDVEFGFGADSTDLTSSQAIQIHSSTNNSKVVSYDVSGVRTIDDWPTGTLINSNNWVDFMFDVGEGAFKLELNGLEVASGTTNSLSGFFYIGSHNNVFRIDGVSIAGQGEVIEIEPKGTVGTMILSGPNGVITFSGTGDIRFSD